MRRGGTARRTVVALGMFGVFLTGQSYATKGPRQTSIGRVTVVREKGAGIRMSSLRPFKERLGVLEAALVGGGTKSAVQPHFEWFPMEHPAHAPARGGEAVVTAMDGKTFTSLWKKEIDRLVRSSPVPGWEHVDIKVGAGAKPGSFEIQSRQSVHPGSGLVLGFATIAPYLIELGTFSVKMRDGQPLSDVHGTRLWAKIPNPQEPEPVFTVAGWDIVPHPASGVGGGPIITPWVSNALPLLLGDSPGGQGNP